MNPADGAVIFWKERVRRASRHIVHTESDDEEQKPTVSVDGSQAGDNEDQAVQVNPKPELGPDIPFPDYLKTILEHWHEEKGNEYPRCKASGRLGSMVWKVFDREGNEVELTWYLVTKPRKYCVLVLHEANGIARFVYCDPPHRTVHGTYLRPWSGVDEKEELEHCAVRVFSSDLEEIEYSSEAWEHLKELQDSSGEEVSRSPSVTRRKSPKDKSVTRKSVKAGCSKRYSMRGRAHQSDEHTEADSSSSSEAGSSSEEEKYVPSPPHKRHKTTDTSNTSNTTEPMKPSKVVFRLGSQRVIGLNWGVIRVTDQRNCVFSANYRTITSCYKHESRCSSMPSLPDSPPPVPPPVPVETHPNRTVGVKPTAAQRALPDPNRLAPEDAYYTSSLPRARPTQTGYDDSLRVLNGNSGTAASVAALRPPPAVPGVGSRKVRGTSRRRRRKGAWKKLLWVKQSYPDNYTDTETFLDHLQRNPRVRPYDFWPLVADSTVIVQHVSSVAIFVCCFVGIVQGRVSPVSVVCWGSVGTALGWIFWDSWILREHVENAHVAERSLEGDDGSSSSSMTSSVNPSGTSSRANGQKENQVHGLGLNMSQGESSILLRRHSAGYVSDAYGAQEPASPTPGPANGALGGGSASQEPDYLSMFSSRNRQRLSTVKSAFLIYFALLGLSPILKSLTKSTASDSIWAMSCWLLIMNIFSFDYGSGEGAGATKFPASLSTNAAVMASTVLASRLPSTTHVFSLMLFSIEVFGLFPIFRRQLRHVSWTGHVLLTLALVGVAGGAVGITLRGGWMAAVVGSILGSILTALAMGGCSWWLISLQKYKNVVTGPWDPARPIIRRHWD
ncbi:phosphatidylinositol:UDP-GlcNAc transferase PIG-C [Aspergillus eucalypticola CBS 122712]|uniref:Phosphatidylinositol:UDP-GlcNAc transferase PIG-C n=1 Tax=Aspergillus eucalypticola (strain CBS 122712 / IBT 29274) TaxID=1448314 RepID=A0A317V3D7_ASPEC|nr:phosphatidylinositol:UDP-GlcNAc transferase PIG-C [Aspergillus eucalypticola CBS 122712]PWY68159.1 phosphatidylinositol:UDP-GlcNAc transferase PIG-C [Aspergillus eucalypticola CBS 122712]